MGVVKRELQGNTFYEVDPIFGQESLVFKIRSDRHVEVRGKKQNGHWFSRIVALEDLQEIFGGEDRQRLERLREAVFDVTRRAKDLAHDVEYSPKSRELLRAIAADLNSALECSRPLELPEEPGVGVVCERGGVEKEFWRMSSGKWVTDNFKYENTDDLLKVWKPVRLV